MMMKTVFISRVVSSFSSPPFFFFFSSFSINDLALNDVH
jgi:hypothetical protein